MSKSNKVGLYDAKTLHICTSSASGSADCGTQELKTVLAWKKEQSEDRSALPVCVYEAYSEYTHVVRRFLKKCSPKTHHRALSCRVMVPVFFFLGDQRGVHYDNLLPAGDNSVH